VGTVDTVANQTDLSGTFRTGAIGHKYVAGVEFSEEKANWDTYKVDTGDRRCANGAGAASGYNCTTVFDPNPADPWAGAIQRNHRPTDVRTRTLSAYLFDSAEITPQWLVNAGLRLDRYDTTLTQAPNASGVRNQFSRQDTLVNYQLGAVYKPVTWGSVYASFGTSSTPAGSFLGQGAESNSLATDAAGNRGDQLAPEKSRAFELGTKWDVLGEKLALTAAVFRIDTDNTRILEQDGTARMAGERRVDGVELGFAGNVTARWAVYGGYTHQKATLRRNGGKGTANGATDGNAFPNTPADSFSFWSTYEVLPGLILGGGANYVSKVWGNEANTKWVPAYWRFDAMAAYRLSKFASVQLNLQNLTDKSYYAQAHRNHYATMAPGRAATLTLTLRY
jgi:catecholate siderophore receptor